MAILLIAIGSLLLYSIPSINKRVRDTLQNINNINLTVGDSDATAARRVIYQNNIELIKDKPMRGYGLGASHIELKEKLFKEGYQKLAADDIGAHSEYLKIFIEQGILGILSFLFLLFFISREFYKNIKENKMEFWMSLLIILTFLTDSMFDFARFAVFYPFFWSLFMFRENEETQALTL